MAPERRQHCQGAVLLTGTTLHDDAFFRASIGAQSASYAFLLIDLPLLVRPADRDRLLRTFAGAQPAEHAVVRCLRQLALLFGAGICFGVLFGVWGRIALFHVQTFFGADIYAAAALHAVKAVDGPGAGSAVNGDGARRAVLSA